MKKTFKVLRDLHDYRRRHLPFLRTIEDVELVREIGLHQSLDRPLTLKVLFAMNIASVATVQRRLSRLKRLGAVQQSRADYDRRILELTVSPQVLRTYERMGRMMVKALA
jgi:hypothetical protein